MNKLFAPFLPPWAETGLQPAFYDLESGTVLQQTARMYDKVNQLIRLFNELSEETQTTVEEYIAKFIELKDFVDDYFDNLDVQEEINNKLDAMAEAGTLQEIVGEYLNATATWGFDTVADMKSSTNLIEGSYAQTLGYYNLNDGGGALYKIRKVTNDDTVDEAFLLEIGDPADELVAELVFDDEVSILQLGAKKFDGTKTDIKTYIDKYIAKLADEKRFTLRIPFGLYHCSEIVFDKSFSIKGDENFNLHNVKGTVISSYVDNQDFIFSVGANSKQCRNFVLKNITFTTADYTIVDGVYTKGDTKTIASALKFINANFGITDNLFFCDIKGTAFSITTSFEIYFGKLNFRHVDAIANGVMVFPATVSGVIASPNISACTFDRIMFEATVGSCMVFEPNCKFFHSHIGVINYEDHANASSDYTQTNFTSDNIATFEASDPIHWSLFRVEGGSIDGIDIDNIELNNFSNRFTTYNSTNYALDRIIDFESDSQQININIMINNISTVGLAKDSCVAYYHDTGKIYTLSQVNINNFTHDSNEHGYKIDIDNFPYFKLNGTLQKRWLTTYIPKLSSSTTPACDILTTRAQRNFYLSYDADAQNPNKLCVKTDATTPGNPVLCFVLNDPTTLKMRAKIPNGATPTIAISGTRYETTQLTGTGAFEIYTINLDPTSKSGDTVQISHAAGTSGEEVLIDYIIN